jgi:methyl-accepting chemotaxis protein
MLTYLLAFAVAIASIGLYAMTFFLPSFKREQDLIWSGVGLFYALVLWLCAGQVRGGLLLGQMSSVALIGWLGWQAFGARWAGLSESEKEQAKILTDIKAKFDQVDFGQLGSSLGNQAKGLANKAKDSAQSIADKTKDMAGDSQDLIDKAKGSAQSIADKAKDVAGGDKASSVVDSIKAAASNLNAPKNKETYVRKEFQEAVETVADKVADQAADVKEVVADAVAELKDAAVDVAEDVDIT